MVKVYNIVQEAATSHYKTDLKWAGGCVCVQSCCCCFFFWWILVETVTEKHRRCSEEDACLWGASSEASVCFSFVKPNTGSRRRNPQTKQDKKKPDHVTTQNTVATTTTSNNSRTAKVSHFQQLDPFSCLRFFWLIFAPNRVRLSQIFKPPPYKNWSQC